MKVVLLMLTWALCGSTNSYFLRANSSTEAATFKPTLVSNRKVSITFTGTVKSIDLLRQRELNIIPVDYDSRFGVTIHIESVTPQGTPLHEATDVAFAIHSPARLFRAGAEEVIGKKYRFKLSWERVGNSSRFTQLTTTAGTYQQQDEPVPSKVVLSRVPEIKIEELTAHPELYDNKLVRVKAVWRDLYHDALLCPLDNDKPCIGAYLEPQDED